MMDAPYAPEVGSEDAVLEAARTRFGVRYLYPYQRLVIANILDALEAPCPAAGERSPENPSGPLPDQPDPLRQIVLLPTGYGKSLCFQLPAVLAPGLTLVVFPLRSLMADQERRLRERKIPCTLLLGGMEEEEKKAAFAAIRSGASRIALANPEILRTDPVLALLRSGGIAHAVVDEAHCVAEWGDDFRPSYADLGVLLRALRPRAVTAFTATASPRIQARISEVLFPGEPFRVVEGNPDRPNIHYSCLPTLSKSHTLERLARELPRPLLVFCSSRPGTQILAENLRERLGTRDVRFYHAGMTKAERGDVEAWFLASGSGILAATCAFGMGIDKPDIRTVLHADSPPSVEAYLQESGRAGRDGRQSRAVLLWHPEDGRRVLREADPLRRGRMRALLEYASESSSCRRERLLGLLGARPESCSGCDVCEGAALAEPEGKRTILAFAARNSGRFRVSEASRLLAGQAGPCALGGALSGWRPEDIREAILSLERAGSLRIPGRGFWKGRLSKNPARRRRTRRLQK